MASWWSIFVFLVVAVDVMAGGGGGGVVWMERPVVASGGMVDDLPVAA